MSIISVRNEAAKKKGVRIKMDAFFSFPTTPLRGFAFRKARSHPKRAR